VVVVVRVGVPVVAVVVGVVLGGERSGREVAVSFAEEAVAVGAPVGHRAAEGPEPVH
jgi:hypothetical protein